MTDVQLLEYYRTHHPRFYALWRKALAEGREMYPQMAHFPERFQR